MTENTILKELVHDPREGALSYKGVRYLLIRPETLAGMQKALERDTGRMEFEALYEGGFAGGYLSSKNYKEMHGFSDRDVLEFMTKMGGDIGWGRFQVEQYDPGEEVLKISVHSSPFAEAYGEADHPVCHLLRGIVAGMGTALFKRECSALETQCRAMGDDCCRFALTRMEPGGEGCRVACRTSPLETKQET